MITEIQLPRHKFNPLLSHADSAPRPLAVDSGSWRENMAGMKRFLKFLGVFELVLFFALLIYGNVIHELWPARPTTLAVIILAVAFVQLGYERLARRRKSG